MVSAQTLDAGLLARKFLNAGVFAISAGSLCVSVTRYDALTQRPGTSRLGVRAAVAEMDEPVLVVNVDERVTQANETAEKLLGAEITGQNVADVVGRDLDRLRERGVFECRTQRGYRQFDPRVSAVTGGGGQQLGATVTLIDVTDREMRRQRIQVLNRILRHNIRNDLSAIQARADLATDDDRDTATEVQRIVTIADELESLSTSARRIETLMHHQDGKPPTRQLDEFVESVVADVTTSGDAATIDATAPSTSVALDWGLLGYALRNVVENAVEHNDTETPHVVVRCETNVFGRRIVVGYNGPGIPELEASAVQTGSEGKLDHATSIGLWGTSWAVQSLGGKVTIGESHLGGAEVTMETPLADDRAAS
jgi:signal transduction histidine kinase